MMRFAIAAALAASLLGVRVAAADDYLERANQAPTPGLNRVGVMADVGVPDGGGLSLVVRPIRAIELHGGVASDVVSTGMRGGVTLVPFAWWCSPSISVEAGRFPDGDANGIARMITQDPTYTSPVLSRVGYEFADLHVGLELGGRWARFYVHAGVSVVTGAVHGLSDPMTGVTFQDDPRVTLWGPSVKVGLLVYLF